MKVALAWVIPVYALRTCAGAWLILPWKTAFRKLTCINYAGKFWQIIGYPSAIILRTVLKTGLASPNILGVPPYKGQSRLPSNKKGTICPFKYSGTVYNQKKF